MWEKGLSSGVVSKGNQQIHSKDEQGEPSEEKIIPALRQATKTAWGICRNNADYSQSYSRPFLILILHFPCGVKISALSSERQPSPNFSSHLGMPHTLLKRFPCLISLTPGGSPWCFPISFGDVLVQPFSVHRAGKGNSAPALGLDLGFLPFPGGDHPQQEVSQSPGIAVCLS